MNMKLKAVRITSEYYFFHLKRFSSGESQSTIFLDKKRDFHRCKKAGWHKPGSFVLSCALNGMFQPLSVNSDKKKP